jgi:putative SOS response-associated peptidase YedK
MNWRPMRTAPKDQVILVTESAGEHYNVVQAVWGRPPGFKDKDAGWWGVAFATSADFMFDLPELRAKLIAITPLAWKPMIEPRRRK